MLPATLARRALGAALTVPLLVPTLVRAQGAQKVINACYVPGTGTVYRIREAGLPQECATGHVAFSWIDGASASSAGATTNAAGTNGNGGGGGSTGATYVKVGDAAGGDLGGTFPNPSVARLQGQPLSALAPALGQVLTWDGAAWGARAAPGVTAHASLSGLANDDHLQYLRTDGTRALGGSLGAGGFKITGLGAATTNGDAVRYEQAVKSGDAAGGDLGGAFPSPTVSKLLGRGLSTTAPANGQVLQWNGTSNLWEPATPAAGGVTMHGLLSGLSNDDHKQYLLAGGNRVANDGFAVSGTMYSGLMAAQGAGTRVLWYPTKSAFRAGTVDAGQWDPGNSGPYSTAFGMNTVANGTAATALGWITTAGGAGALAAGRSSIASGTSAMALGENTQATAAYATATGNGSIASGEGAVALGNATASGSYAVALGHATASGTGAFAAGQGVTADAAGTFVAGTAATAFGRAGSFVFGDATGGTSAVFPTVPNQFVVRASGGTTFYSNTALSSGVSLAPGAGGWSTLSDVRKKTNFRAVDGDAVLDKLARMDIREWSYISQDAAIRHVGPTAQDFRHAFGLGENETTINTVDADGISLLGVQALTRRLARQQDEIAALQTALDRLEARLARAEPDAGVARTALRR